MKLLLTGGCGFLGSNLAAEAVRRNIDLTVVDNLSRKGSTENLAWLRSLGTFSFVESDVRSFEGLAATVSDVHPDAIFHLAGQVAMTTSLRDPRLDFETNALGTFNVLEAVRTLVPHALVCYSSTNKVYGALDSFAFSERDTRFVCDERPLGFDESTPLNFQSPYGCSKGTADQYMLDYARMYGLRTTVFRHSSMCGGRQFATFDQGWITWFCSKALEQRKGDAQGSFSIAGTGKQVRDVLHAKDMIALYFGALENPAKLVGQAFNVGGGMSNSLSLLELFSKLENLFSIPLSYSSTAPRPSDQPVFVANTAKLRAAIGWEPEVSVDDALRDVIGWLET